MRRTALIVVFILMAAHSLYAGDVDFLFTDGMRNGNGFGSDVPILVRDTEIYTIGCIDALYATDNTDMRKLYPGATKGEIVNAVKRYYQKNPAMAGKTIIQVIMDGCK